MRRGGIPLATASPGKGSLAFTVLDDACGFPPRAKRTSSPGAAAAGGTRRGPELGSTYPATTARRAFNFPTLGFSAPPS